jgi:hypothetical protein
MNVGYFSIPYENQRNFIRWDILDKKALVKQTKYFRHIRFDKPLNVRMDGRKRISLITF